MLSDVRGSLSHALRNAGIDKAVTLHSLRHTYTAARLQTTDHGAPVSIFTVMRELGHRSIGLIETTYGHLRSRGRRVFLESLAIRLSGNGGGPKGCSSRVPTVAC